MIQAIDLVGGSSSSNARLILTLNCLRQQATLSLTFRPLLLAPAHADRPGSSNSLDASLSGPSAVRKDLAANHQSMQCLDDNAFAFRRRE